MCKYNWRYFTTIIYFSIIIIIVANNKCIGGIINSISSKIRSINNRRYETIIVPNIREMYPARYIRIMDIL